MNKKDVLKEFFFYTLDNCVDRAKADKEKYELLIEEDKKETANERIMIATQVVSLLEWQLKEFEKARFLLEKYDGPTICTQLVSVLKDNGYDTFIDTNFMSEEALNILWEDDKALLSSDIVKTIWANAMVLGFWVSKNKNGTPSLFMKMEMNDEQYLIPIELLWRKSSIKEEQGEIKHFSWELFFESLPHIEKKKSN